MTSWYVNPAKIVEELADADEQLKVKACGVCGTDLHIHEGEFLAKV